MRKRKWLWTGLLICMLLVGCKSQESVQDNAKAEEDERIQIGLSFDSFVIERWIRDRDVFVSTANELGADVNVQNANGDVKEQISQIEYLIGKGMDVIVIVASDETQLKDVVQKIHEAGIPVVCYDRLIRGCEVDLYVSFDNVMVGRLMAQALKEAIPEGGKIFAVRGPVEDYNVELASRGFEEEIKDSNLEVVYEANCDGWLAEMAFSYVNEGYERYPDVKGVMCGNDDLASQAFKALAEKQLAGEVALTGQDAELSACQRVVEGTQTMTVYKSVEDLAVTAARSAVKLAKGEKLDIRESIDDGESEIPFQKLEPVAVTRDNMDEIIIDGGFHLKEDVYLNLDEKNK